jgi:hypothetical protein
MASRVEVDKGGYGQKQTDAFGSAEENASEGTFHQTEGTEVIAEWVGMDWGTQRRTGRGN